MCDSMDFTASETWLKNFSGSDTKRNICRISFPCYFCLYWGGPDDLTPCLRVCQALAGFRTVTLVLELLCEDVEDEGEFIERYCSTREDFQAALEPHLGPC